MRDHSPAFFKIKRYIHLHSQTANKVIKSALRQPSFRIEGSS